MMPAAVLLLALAAPLPFPRDTKPAFAPGAYAMTWRGMAFDAVFHDNGTFECWSDGNASTSRFLGQWTFADGVLSVNESPLSTVEEDGAWPPSRGWSCRWSSKIGKRLEGDLTVNGVLTLPLTLKRK